MYDPFTNNVGTANLLTRLNDIRGLIEKFIASSPEPEATDLLEQIKDLVAVTASLDELARNERRKSSEHLRLLSPTDHIHLNSVNGCTSTITRDCVELLEPLQAGLEDLGNIRKTDAAEYVSTQNQLVDQPWFEDMSQDLRFRTEVLQILLSAVNLLYHKNDTDADGNLSDEVSSFASTLQYQLASVKPKLQIANRQSTNLLRRAVKAATEVTLHVPASLNKHFIVGRSVKSFYTGRTRPMARLKAAFEDTTYFGQKRFVIYGLGGSGKTELALKYAEESAQNYWGVFFVDGSSQKNASGSYSEIAKIGGVEPNEKAAKNWLMTRALPWLLIIDNVDDNETRLEELLPSGTRGCILVTSRNPAHKTYGTVGDRFLELLPMEYDEANMLILKAAEEPAPWTESVVDAANDICQKLGFLPLALVHAGKAIMLKLCSWYGYLNFYERQILRIRRERLHQRSRSSSRSRQRFKEDDDSINVFSSYEILYQSLESSQKQSFQDAVELLHLFSHLHFQNIRLDIFIGAAINPLEEARYREKEEREERELQKKVANLKRTSWSTWFRESALRLLQYLDTPPPVPAVLRNSDELSESIFKDDIRDRLNMAIAVLVSRSLVIRQDRLEDCYSMHPLVHRWVRDRPEMSTSQQALWCQLATTTLARSILFPPPLGETDFDRSMRRELRQHIVHVRACQEVINEGLETNRMLRKSVWPVIKSGFGRHQALEAARFSRVYSECGDFNEALQLQSRVRTFVTELLGEDHRLSILASLFLAGTLYELSRTSESTRLQRRIYDICVASLGEDHPLTLKVMDLLGCILCFQGRWAESLGLHQRAVKGMTKLYGKEHENTLKALNHQARVVLRDMDYKQAAKLHQEAWEGMKKRLGEIHLDTLECLEDLAVSRIRLDAKYFPDCHDKMTFVLDQRIKRLGKEQPYTLLAICNLGRVKSAMGRHAEAAKIMKPAYEIAARNLGEDHYGVLAGKSHYAQVLVQVGQYEQAEKMFLAVIDKPQYRKVTDQDGEHPDRCLALWYLVGCLEKQGKFQEAIEICEILVKALQDIGGNGLGMRHKFATMVQNEVETLKQRILDNVPAEVADSDRFRSL